MSTFYPLLRQEMVGFRLSNTDTNSSVVYSHSSWFIHDFGEKLNKEGRRVVQFFEEKEEMTE
jgi:hypothetical protein